MTKRAGKLPNHWKERATDPSGRHLMKNMLIDFYVYPRHDKRWSFLSYYLKSARQRCTEGNHKPLREAEVVCERLQKLASEICFNKPREREAEVARDVGLQGSNRAPADMSDTSTVAQRGTPPESPSIDLARSNPAAEVSGGLSSVTQEARIRNKHGFPTPEIMLSTVLAAKRPLKALEVHLIAVGEDPKTAQIGSLGKRIQQELHAMKNAGLLHESRGR